MTVVELFAGAGGASLGLVAAGFTEVRAVEWNHDACETRRAAGLRCDEGDVRDPAHYAGVEADAVWSSFPCQAWSTAGKRLGKDDPRNGWPWTVDVLDQVKPTWFMAENVPGLTHHRAGCNGRCVDDCARLYFEGTILADLRARFASVQWSILDAARFGVPQNRERLIIVAGPRPIEWPRETHAPPEELIGLFEARRPWVTVRQALGLGGSIVRESGVDALPLLDGDTGLVGGGDLTDRPAWTVAADVGRNRGGAMQVIEDPKHPHVRPDAPAPALRSGGAGHSAPPMWLNQTSRGAIPQSRRPMRLDTPADTAPSASLGVSTSPRTRCACSTTAAGAACRSSASIQASGEGPRPPCIPDGMWLRTGNETRLGGGRTEDYERGVDEPAPTVRVTMPHSLVTRAASRPELLDKPSPAVLAREVKGTTVTPTTGTRRASDVQCASDALYLGTGIRRLTPAECATLQAFPPDHPWRGTKTSIYAQIGNAVCPPVACAVALAVRRADAQS